MTCGPTRASRICSGGPDFRSDDVTVLVRGNVTRPYLSQPAVGGMRDASHGVSTRSGSERVSGNDKIEFAKRLIRSLPLPVLTSSVKSGPTLCIIRPFAISECAHILCERTHELCYGHKEESQLENRAAPACGQG